jgi:hypothetical protein
VVAGDGQDVAKREKNAPATVDPRDEPSAAWGWHGGFPKASLIAGWVSTIIVLLMLIGNHQGRVEDLWLVAIGLGMIALLIRHTMHARRSWRR